MSSHTVGSNSTLLGINISVNYNWSHLQSIFGCLVCLSVMSSDDAAFLDDILRRVTGSQSSPIHNDEYCRLTTLFIPAKDTAIHAKAFLVLSAICDHAKRKSTNADMDEDSGIQITQKFWPWIEHKLADVEEGVLLEALSFVVALFSVDWHFGSLLFLREGFQDSMMDCLDIFSRSTELALAVADMLSLASGHKSCISALSPRCTSWLNATFYHCKDAKVKTKVTVALLKLSQSSVIQGNVEDAALPTGSRTQQELYDSLSHAVIDSNSINEAVDAIEGLAYLSNKPIVKENISNDAELLRKLTAFRSPLNGKYIQSNERLSTAPYGLATVIANICAYRPRLTEEQAQVERLRRMAQPATALDQDKEADMDELDNDDQVRLRASRLIQAGAVALLVTIARASESTATRMTVSKALLSLIEDKSNRGKILQAGGSKALMGLIRASKQTQVKDRPSPSSNDEFVDFLSIQALAKLSITASPLQVFGPDENAMIEAIKPFVYLLQHPSSTLLQKFEAIMALTNISSSSPEMATRISETGGLLSKLEFLLLDENNLIRRAATELVCNLVSGSESAYNRFSGDSSDSSSGRNQSYSRLHILSALADVEDEPTRLAASGALAVLTSSSVACKSMIQLQEEHHRLFLTLNQLIDLPLSPPSKLGFVHRGVVCIRNILVNSPDERMRDNLTEEAVQYGILQSLVKIIKSTNDGNITEEVLRPTAEALKRLMDFGINVFT